jgi:hypothetical protein
MLWHTGRWPPSTSGLYLKIPDENLTLIVLANTDNLTVPFNSIGKGDVSKSLLALTFFRHFIFPARYGTALPEIYWSATEGPIIKQLSAVGDPIVREFLERELWAYRQAYASVGRQDQVNKLWRVNQRAFPNSTMQNDELFTHTVGSFPIVPPSLSAATFAKLSWGILLWLVLIVISMIGMLIFLALKMDMPKFQWLYWLLSALFLGPVSLLIYGITRSPRGGPLPSKWQPALVGSAFVVSIYALGWALAFTALPFFGQNPHPIAILGITYLTPLLVSTTFLRIPCIFSWGKDRPVRRLLCSFGIELISMNIAYAVMFPLTMLLNQVLTTIPGSLNPFYWAMLSLISVVNLLAQFPVNYWLVRRGIFALRFSNSSGRTQQDIPSIRNAWPALAVSVVIVVGALGLTISQLT